MQKGHNEAADVDGTITTGWSRGHSQGGERIALAWGSGVHTIALVNQDISVVNASLQKDMAVYHNTIYSVLLILSKFPLCYFSTG